MKFVLNRPMSPAEVEQVFSGCLLGRQTCDAILCVVRDLPRLCADSLDVVFIDLRESRPVTIRCEQSAGT